MEERKPIDRTKEREEEERQKKEDKRRLTAKGIAAGSALSTGGGLLYLDARKLGKEIASGKEIKKVGKLEPIVVSKKGKLIGLAALGVGVPTLGISAYKHYKYKKEDKKEKGKQDDNKA